MTRVIERSLRPESSDRQTGGKRLRASVAWVRRHSWGVLSVVGGLALWQMTIDVFDVSPLVMSSPTTIVAKLVDMAGSGELWKHFEVSARQFLLGYVGCALFAIPLGLLMGSVMPVRKLLEPWISALYATPNVALAPVFIIWLGFGVTAKAGVVALVAFFPIVINTISGVDTLSKHYYEVGSAFSANRREVFIKILLPGSIPAIFTGLRLASARALVGLVVADFFGATSGLGYLILVSAQSFNTPQLFAATSVLAISGVVLMQVLVKLERLLSPWRRAA